MMIIGEEDEIIGIDVGLVWLVETEV